MDPAKLKVVELRQELQTRGLDTRGVKAVLVDRLRLALEAEGAAIRDQVLGVSPTKFDGNVSQDELDTSAAEEDVPPVQEPEPVVEAPVVADVPVVESVPENVGIIIDDSSEQPSVDEVAEEPASDLDNSQAPYHLNETQPIDQVATTQLSSGTTYEEESASASATNASTEDVEMLSTERTVPPIDEENDNAADVPEEKVVDETMEVTDAPPAKSEDTESKNVDEASQETTPADDLKAAQEEEVAKEAAAAAAATPTTEENASSQQSSRKDGEESRKRKRSRSPSPKRRTRTNSTAANADDFTNVEDEPVIDPDKVTLSWFDSDLQLRINSTDFCDARPISDAACGLSWAGARATHGVRVGQKVFYEVQLSQKNSRVNFEQEKHLFNLRCGWSTQDSSLQLGDAPLSFGYDGEGKKIRDGQSEEYGRKLEVDDVVGVYLDLQSDPCTMEYTLNGESLGVAFELTQEELGEAALFPHIVSKNLSFAVNFGQMENNLLHDLKAKPRKKEPEAVPEATTAEEKTKEEESSAEEKAEATPAAATEEKTEAEGDTVAPDTDTAVVEESAGEPEATIEPSQVDEDTTKEEAEEETKKKEDAAAPSDDVEMTDAEKPTETNNVDEEEKKIEEEPAIVAAEEEPLPEINRENLPGYLFIGLVDKDQLVAGPVRPESRKECEVIMMIGLPGSGKTKWAKEWAAEHPEKKYVVISATTLIERMQNPNLGRKIESSGRRQRLSELCTRSLGALQDVAQKRRRNYILDQTNVFASAQRRRMKGFGEFRRMAVIVVPTDEEYVRRQESCKNDIDKDNTETEQNEMKANLTLPTMDLGWFDEIKYTDLEEAEATKLVEDYNAKGKKALPPPQKKRPSHDYRNDNRRRDFNNRDRSYSRWGGSSDNRRGGGGYDNNRGGDRWASSGGGGGGHRSGPYHGGGGGGGGGYRGPSSRDYDDRRQDRWGGSGSGGGGGSSSNWMNNNRRDYRSGGSSGGRSDSYGGRDQYRDNQQRNHYGGGRDQYSSSSSSSSHHNNRRNDQDFRERRREDGGISNRRYDSGRTVGATGRPEYQKRDNGSAKSTDMMNNGSGTASQWNNAANWQQQQQWSNWQQVAAAGSPAWNQGWAATLQQQQQPQQDWQSWGQSATNTSSSAGQWKSYGSATAGSTGSTSGTGAAAGQATGHWDGHQWTY